MMTVLQRIIQGIKTYKEKDKELREDAKEDLEAFIEILEDNLERERKQIEWAYLDGARDFSDTDKTFDEQFYYYNKYDK